MRIGFLYGTHGGDEPLSVELGRSLERDPAKNIFPYPVNERAIWDGTRFYEENMAWAMSHPDRLSPIYERRRAAEVIAWVLRGKFDIVIDFHTAQYPGNDAVFIHNRTSRLAALGGRYLGFRDFIVSDHGIQSQVSHAIGIDVSYDPKDSMEHAVTHWRRELGELAAYQDLEELDADYSPLGPARFWRYCSVLSTADLGDSQDIPGQIARLPYAGPAYQEFYGTERYRFGLPPGAVTMNVGDKYVKDGIVGEALTPIALGSCAPWHRLGGMNSR